MEPTMRRLCATVRQTSFELHRYLGGGHLEKVYENGLLHRLRKQGLSVRVQHPLKVYDEDGTVLGDYLADLLIEDCLIAELKACKALAEEHVGQLFGYLRASRIEHGMLINFGPARFEVKKFVLSPRGMHEDPPEPLPKAQVDDMPE